jgi:polyferredoxin
VLRARTLIYTGLLVVITAVAGVSLALKNPLKVDVIRDRGALAREAAPGVIENVYRLQIMNTSEAAHRFTITAEGLPGLAVAGIDQPIEVAGASTQLVPFRLQAPVGDDDERDAEREVEHKGRDGGQDKDRRSRKVELVIQAQDDPAMVRREKSTFLFPR